MNKTDLDLETLISSYSHLPKHMLVQYAYDCALECKELMHKEERDCLEVVEKWLIGEATEAELREAGDKVYITDPTAAASVSYVYASAYNAAYAAYYATYHAALNASEALNKPIDYYYDKFLNHINNLTTLEKMLYLVKT